MDNFNINLRDLRSLSSLDFLSVILACDTLPSAYIPTCITDPTASLLDNIFFIVVLVQNSVSIRDVSDHLPIFSSMICLFLLTYEAPGSWFFVFKI